MKTTEQAIRDKILYIGDKIPETLMDDTRPKFIVLGTPQELIDETNPVQDEKLQKGKWTREELNNHIKLNVKDTYSMAVVLSALYMKLYGFTLPDIGLSGFQGETAESLSKFFPNP